MTTDASYAFISVGPPGGSVARYCATDSASFSSTNRCRALQSVLPLRWIVFVHRGEALHLGVEDGITVGEFFDRFVLVVLRPFHEKTGERCPVARHRTHDLFLPCRLRTVELGVEVLQEVVDDS